MANPFLSRLFFPLLILCFYSTLPSVKTLSISGYGIKDLEGDDEVTFQKEADWWNLTTSISSNKITQTTTTLKWLLGGQDILGDFGGLMESRSFQRVYTDLPPHSFVGITAVFWFFDHKWDGTSCIEIIIDEAFSAGGPRNFNERNFPSFEGGIPGEYDLGRVHFKTRFAHNKTTLKVSIEDMPFANSHDQSFGFRELDIHLSNDSYLFPSYSPMCQISEDVNQLAAFQCACSLNEVQDADGDCVSCAANCDICYGPADHECLRCSSGTYWDGTKCNTCDISCQTCNGPTANDCLTCKYAFYNYGNTSCLDKCEPIFAVKAQIGLERYCSKMCDSSQFYWSYNRSCLDSCDLPLVHGLDENGFDTCSNPCPNIAKYLYANGSCYDTCKPPLLPIVEKGVKFCRNPCSETSYLFTNRSCFLTCPSPLISRSEPGVNYCWNPCPSVSSFLYGDGSCSTICPAPLVSRSEPGIKYCYSPCSSVDEYVYDNQSCFGSCLAPLGSRVEPWVARYCLNPCLSIDYFLYPNGSCIRDCSFPLLNRTEPGAKYCFNPCPGSSDYIYPNATCSDWCPYPLMSRDEPGFKYCFTPCNEAQYLYNDQSCSSACDFPLIKIIESGVKYCKTLCANLNEFVYSDGECRSVCEYPYKILSQSGYKICELNLNEIQINQARSLAQGTDIANTICGIGGILTGFVTPGDPTSMLMWSLLKMLYFTKYIEVNLPGQLAVIFAKQNENYQNDGGYMSSIGEGRILLSSGASLGRFSYYNISLNFLENYWQQLTVFAYLIALMIVLALVLRFLKNPFHIKFVKYLESALQWNLILMFFCGSYGDLILYSALEFQAVSFGSFKTILSFIVCLVMILLAIYVPLKILYVIYDIRKVKMSQQSAAVEQRGDEKKWVNQRIFFESYHSEHAIQHIFLFLYLIRVASFNMIIAYIFKSPLAQVLLINFINSTMTAYLLLKRPIKDKLCFIQHITIEVILLIYHFCLLILVGMDLADSQAEGTRAFFGGVMVVVLIVGPVTSAFLITLKLFLKSKDIYYRYKRQKEAIELVGPAFRFRRVRARGQFIIEGEENNSTSLGRNESHHQDGERTEFDESRLVGMSQKKNRELTTEEGNLAPETLRKPMTDQMEISLEKNLESSIVQTYTKKQQNSKRRKINLFRDNFVPPD